MLKRAAEEVDGFDPVPTKRPRLEIKQDPISTEVCRLPAAASGLVLTLCGCQEKKDASGGAGSPVLAEPAVAVPAASLPARVGKVRRHKLTLQKKTRRAVQFCESSRQIHAKQHCVRSSDTDPFPNVTKDVGANYFFWVRQRNDISAQPFIVASGPALCTFMGRIKKSRGQEYRRVHADETWLIERLPVGPQSHRATIPTTAFTLAGLFVFLTGPRRLKAEVDKAKDLHQKLTAAGVPLAPWPAAAAAAVAVAPARA